MSRVMFFRHQQFPYLAVRGWMCVAIIYVASVGRVRAVDLRPLPARNFCGLSPMYPCCSGPPSLRLKLKMESAADRVSFVLSAFAYRRPWLLDSPDQRGGGGVRLGDGEHEHLGFRRDREPKCQDPRKSVHVRGQQYGEIPIWNRGTRRSFTRHSFAAVKCSVFRPPRDQQNVGLRRPPSGCERPSLNLKGCKRPPIPYHFNAPIAEAAVYPIWFNSGGRTDPVWCGVAVGCRSTFPPFGLAERHHVQHCDCLGPPLPPTASVQVDLRIQAQTLQPQTFAAHFYMTCTPLNNFHFWVGETFSRRWVIFPSRRCTTALANQRAAACSSSAAARLTGSCSWRSSSPSRWSLAGRRRPTCRASSTTFGLAAALPHDYISGDRRFHAENGRIGGGLVFPDYIFGPTGLGEFVAEVVVDGEIRDKMDVRRWSRSNDGNDRVRGGSAGFFFDFELAERAGECDLGIPRWRHKQPHVAPKKRSETTPIPYSYPHSLEEEPRTIEGHAMKVSDISRSACVQNWKSTYLDLTQYPSSKN